MTTKRVLLLGGTGDALRVARALDAAHIYSVAGLARVPTDLQCAVHVGGFGGVPGLCDFIQAESITLILDMTHPYAAQMSQHAASAATLQRIEAWAFRRAPWQPQAGDDWRDATDLPSIIGMIESYRHPFWTMGKEPLEHLSAIPESQHWTIRCLDDHPGNAHSTVIAARGPFTLEAEHLLFDQLSTDVLISKNSGGQATEAKLSVARERGIPVIMLRRPALPCVDREFDHIDTLANALEVWSASTPIFNKVP